MTPFERAISSQLSAITSADFFAALNAHFLHGSVHSDESAFLMTRPVSATASKEQITDPQYRFPEADCNAWFVYLAAGNIADLIELAPYPLEFVCYERFGVLKILRFQSISEKVKQWERKKHGHNRRRLNRPH
jgi:hypothetical protein